MGWVETKFWILSSYALMLWKSNFPELLRVILGWQVWGGGGLMDGEDGPQLNQLAPICLATLRQLSKKSKVIYQTSLILLLLEIPDNCKYYVVWPYFTPLFIMSAFERHSLNEVIFAIQPRVMLWIKSSWCCSQEWSWPHCFYTSASSPFPQCK